jgi:hypothetical protein
MTQNHFDVKPVEKKAAKEFQTKAIKLEEKLNKTVKDNLDLKKEILEYQKAIKFGTLTEGLSKGKKEKILSLLEGLKFTTVDDFEAKVKICIEKVNKTVTPKAKEDTVIEESFVPETKIVKEVKSEIDRYL